MAGITQGDYRMDGKLELITATTDGESEWRGGWWGGRDSNSVLFAVRGYLPAPPESQNNMMDLNVEQETLRDLSARKQNLLLELNNYETNQKQSLGGKTGGTVGPDGNEMGVIPAQTQLQTALAINLGSEGKPVS